LVAYGELEVDVPLIVSVWDRFRVTISAEGLSADSRDFMVDSFPEETEVFFELRAGHVLRERVVDADSNPVEGARVLTWNRVREAEAGNPLGYTLTTVVGESVWAEADGRFAIPILEPLGVTLQGLELGAECASLRVEAGGVSTAVLASEELDLDAGELTIRLKRGGVVTGHVAGVKAGEDVFVVLFSMPFFAEDVEGVWQANTTLDETGAFRFDAVPEGLVYATVWRGSGTISTERAVLVSASEDAVVDFDLAEWGRLTGELRLDLSGSLLEGKIEPEAMAMTVELFVAGGDAAWAPGFHSVVRSQVRHGDRFDLPSVATEEGFLRVGLNQDWFIQIALAGLGGDIDLGKLDVVVADFESHDSHSGGPEPPR
jgi:hypothetical protein